ncbi:MAG: hypothetical protein UR29_C0002G0007 [Candidatus Woesebacteria bacterium GW2011_GWC2_33_12]|uniref:Uncharacterized protein n=1 Tax=Candidatus Woesebacteria bacterium GW2011_GWB1_33_22 TaxID=1618566 RepID=A0A0G0CPC3_9BACT|nr:MAG: hypothetical protein UR29_C0002G0007 [Candidatus Woesebacteria bacterium GW2011_GWC2_33_12]KKP42479.1 MAG: hypothetical protein UR33_C0002G0055 [Candidatus Woesebacteria bacterium GW2011_GWA2_33_20]KKP45222.1 MAG: hypothetical protein UR35_C0002G0055 [Candidatus Woesebacteria bacterium GW2011_GWB1_33_22]KKP46483.1 MAG: hypothetical protein UR37_C0007G0040 [Microgenomates group bacterium GW2011_GWC1_33_28]KKP50892.1 MAG: hypothetical protein UR41_C0002G0056 [Candidatus Woesebacteria bact
MLPKPGEPKIVQMDPKQREKVLEELKRIQDLQREISKKRLREERESTPSTERSER